MGCMSCANNWVNGKQCQILTKAMYSLEQCIPQNAIPIMKELPKTCGNYKATAPADAKFVKEVKQLVKDNPDIELALSKAGEKEGEE